VPEQAKSEEFFEWAKNVGKKCRGVRGKKNFFEKNFALCWQGLTSNFLRKIMKISIKPSISSNSGGREKLNIEYFLLNIGKDGRMVAYKLQMTVKVPNRVDAIAVAVLLFIRRLIYGYPFRRVPLTRGRYAIVDPEDYAWLVRHKWHASDGRGGNFYAVNRKMQKMHRLIMRKTNPKFEIRNSKLFVDHINRNGLDNRKANLRLVTPTQNNWNNGQRVERYSSKYRGVSWHKRQGKWAAVISVGGRAKHVGYFDDEEEAARAFDEAAKGLRGEYAVLNFPTKKQNRRER
jgi:hypothetical protein